MCTVNCEFDHSGRWRAILIKSHNIVTSPAQVAELADALASGASVRKDVGVQVPPWAQLTGIFTPHSGSEVPVFRCWLLY